MSTGYTETTGNGRDTVNKKTTFSQWRRQYFSYFGVSRRGEGSGEASSPEIFWLLNLEMAHFDAHLR